MEDRKRVDIPRRYRHMCPAHGGRDEQIPQEICPDCGQRGEFWGFYQGMWSRMSRQSQLLGFPCSGVQMTFLPKLIRSCQRCTGEGIARGDDFDYECPDCAGKGGFLIRTESEMQKIRRWALARHQREINENPKSNHPARIWSRPTPGNLIVTRELEAFVRGFMSIHDYHKKYGERNDQIGERILPCDPYGWDIFMEIVEIWDQTGRALQVSQDAILLKSSSRKNAVTLISLYPPSEHHPQHMLLNRPKIRQVFGHRLEHAFWQRIEPLSTSPQGRISVDEQLTINTAREWLFILLDKVER
jgi:hypothetical protein